MGFLDFVKGKLDNLHTEVKKIKNKYFLEAVVAGSALVAAADGKIEASEKQKFVGFMSRNDALKVYDTNTIITLFNKYVDHLEFDFSIGENECLKMIQNLKDKPEEAKLMVIVCCAIGSADGNFDDKEKAVVRKICNTLGVNPHDFHL